MSVPSLAATPDLTVKPVGISVAVAPTEDRVVVCVDGREPIGLSPEDALKFALHLSAAVQQLADLEKARRARPQ
jgi:hypothetical protein